ncbi:MAG: hypothetical protein COB83_08060 [Gammaproteobacteria bacterium]|nr:MAG: hypothetical protein COB83_08060 [Gammaproteobacteria bacterium]
MPNIRKIQPVMIQCPSATGNGYNEDWTIKLQAGMTYHSIELETNLVKVPTIKKVTIDIGGTPIAYATNVMLDVLDKLYKKFQQTGRFIFDLSKFEYRSPAGIFQTQLVTGLRDDVTLTIEFGAKDAADPVVPTLKAKAWVTDNDGAGRLFIPNRYELTQYSAAAGDHSWDFPNGSITKHLQRIIFKEDVVAISEIKVKRGRNTIHTIKRSDLDYMLQRHAGVALQAGYCVLDFTLFGFGTHGAIATNGLSFELVTDGAGAIKTYVEGYEQVAFPQQQA